MNILFIGDIFGRPGRNLLASHLSDLVSRHAVDLVVANGENAAAGFGITPRLTEELLALDIDVLTSGNHIWDRKEILEYLPRESRLLRPANYPGELGHGAYLGKTRGGVEYAVINLQGRVFMASTDCPFRTADRELEKLPSSCKIRIVDIHRGRRGHSRGAARHDQERQRRLVRARHERHSVRLDWRRSRLASGRGLRGQPQRPRGG
ncbi:MAG: YmdB family metallophosphoesterase, partial [Acidobacteria bacterium]|nr:YmdB family metallophosphoesterase [Acidobacteriota bacterium]